LYCATSKTNFRKRGAVLSVPDVGPRKKRKEPLLTPEARGKGKGGGGGSR